MLFASSNPNGPAAIYLLRAGQQEWTQLASISAGGLAWSPDGKWIAFQQFLRNESSNIWKMRADGTQQTQLTRTKPGTQSYKPAWSPDGKQILFVSSRKEEGDDDSFQMHIYVMRTDGSDQRRLKMKPLDLTDGADWSPDGKQIAYARKTSEESANIFVADSEGRNERAVTRDQKAWEMYPKFSPDGKSLAFSSMSEAVSVLVVMNVDGTNRRDLPVKEIVHPPIGWSPDGKWLVYTARTYPDGKLNDDVIALPLAKDGKPIKLLGSDKREYGASWRPR